jgi:hypothetical protein
MEKLCLENWAPRNEMRAIEEEVERKLDSNEGSRKIFKEKGSTPRTT